jgi:hypothetical protein
MTDFTDKAWQDTYEFKQKVITPIFPNASLSQSGFFCNPDLPIRAFSAHLSSRNLFEGTSYEYNGNGIFLHFTSLPILSTILKSGFIRMSDFNCLTDKSEINFARQHFKKIPNNEGIESEKEKMFCLSACESNQEVVLDAHMWEHYADKGHGCSIEYKFTSPRIANMSFGKIQYGKRKLKPLKDIDTLMQIFALSNNGFKVIDPMKFLAPIFAFHKDVKFQKENEVRLFYYQDGSIFNDKPHLNQYKDFYKQDQVRNFIKIYLSGKNKYVPYPGLDDEAALGVSPQIEITKVIIGPNVENVLETIDQLLMFKEEEKQEFEIWRVTQKSEYFKLNIR